MAWRDGRRVEDCTDIDRLDELLHQPDLLVHLDLLLDGVHDQADLHALAKELGFADVSVEDVLAPSERVKIQRRAGYFFLTTYATSLPIDPQALVFDTGPEAVESRLHLTRVSTFILRNGLVTVRSDDGFTTDEVVERWEADPELLKVGVGAMMHGLLDAIVDGHFEVIQQLDDSMEALEDVLFAEGNHVTQVQRSSYRMRKELVQLRRAVLPMREVVNTLTRPGLHNEMIDRQLAGEFDDLYDHVLRAAEWTESLRDMIGSIFETNLSLQDSRLNIVMKKLAGWAAVIAVPTAVTGWFGQNVPFPGFQTHVGLVESIVVMLVGTVGMYLLLRRRDWI